jgi:hypothetical protein
MGVKVCTGVRGAVRDTALNGGGGRNKFSAMKVPRQCPLVLLEKVV